MIRDLVIKTTLLLAFVLFLASFLFRIAEASETIAASWYDSNSVKKEGTCHAEKCYTASGKKSTPSKKLVFCSPPATTLNSDQELESFIREVEDQSSLPYLTGEGLKSMDAELTFANERLKVSKTQDADFYR